MNVDGNSRNFKMFKPSVDLIFRPCIMQSSSSTPPIFDTENDTASNSHRFRKSSTNRHTSKTPKSTNEAPSTSKESRKKRHIRSSQDSFTTEDDEPESLNKPSQSKTGKDKMPSKKSRKSNSTFAKTNGKNGSSELVSGSEDKLQVAVIKNFPLNSKSNYSEALNLTSLTGSIEEGEKLFGVLIKPVLVSTFMTSYWEQKPIRIQRRFSDYYKDLISTEVIDKMLRENHVEFTKNIDITQYKDGVRETLNPNGRAMPPCNYDCDFRFKIFS